MIRLLVFFVTMMLFTATNVFAQNSDAVVGEWYTAEGTSIMEIYKCDDLYCGKIVWLKKPKNEEGKDKVDTKNPDETKRNRKLMGLEILWGFKYKGENQWEGGKIYDPKNGKTYSCKIKLEGNELKVRGFVGFSLFGRTTIWTKKT
ncbi:MAG: hypothetical protein A2Y66_07855 [Nitrospirae bacterium RBG_13_41_22]|nr:MAG: hypothetical protein A2Y66_07855 [Nitrospirae bacterium RBG_13_41_22]